jgi:hypothetical protein
VVVRLTVAVLLVGCSASPASRPAAWSYVHAAIIAPNCATSSCHSARTAAAGVALDDPDTAYKTLIDRQYVIPGDDGSTLLLLLDGDERQRMPPDAPLPLADIDLVRTWIEEGATK